MTETVRTIQGYLFLGAVLQGASSVPILFRPDAPSIGMTLGVLGGAVALGYLFLCVQLPSLVRHAPGRALWVLYAGATYQVLLFVVLGVFSGLQADNFFVLGLALMILWYLATNIRRLASL